MSRVNHLFESVNQIIPNTRCSVPDVVYPFKDDQPPYATLFYDVPVKSTQGGRAQTLAKHAIAADSFVQNGYLSCIGILLKAVGQFIRPAILFAMIATAAAESGAKTSIVLITYQWSVRTEPEKCSFDIAFPGSMYEVVLEPGWPVTSAAVLPK